MKRIASRVSFEVVDDRLMMIIEGNQSADMAPIPDALNESRRLDLVVFLDQTRGVVAARTPHGRALAKLESRDYRAASGTHIALTNNIDRNSSGELRLERLEVQPWNGRLPSELPDAQDVIDVGEESQLTGKLIGLTSDSKEVSFVDEGGTTSKIP